MNRTLLLMTTCFMLSGCGIKRFYSGPPRPQNEIARVRFGENGAKVVNIDDASSRIAMIKRYGYEVLPGPHTIEVEYQNVLTSGKGSCFIKFDAEAGKEYQVIGFEDRSGTWLKWGAFLRKYSNGYTRDEFRKAFSKENDILCKFSEK